MQNAQKGITFVKFHITLKLLNVFYYKHLVYTVSSEKVLTAFLRSVFVEKIKRTNFTIKR